MTLFQSLVLAIVQGIAEFLPISSKGHLNLTQSLLGLTPSLTLDILLNTATLLSVVVFFRRQISFFIKNLLFLIVGTLPAVVVTLLFRHQINTIFASPRLLPPLFLITAALLFSTKFVKSSNKDITYLRAFAIGLFQALAILPGVSRSGSTIVAGLLLGLPSETAFNFSFALLIPASIGALIFDLKDISLATFASPNLWLAFTVAFLVGLVSLSLLHRLLVQKKIWYFGFYVTAVSLLSFFLIR